MKLWSTCCQYDWTWLYVLNWYNIFKHQKIIFLKLPDWLEMLCALNQVQLAQSCCIYVHDSRWLNSIKLHNSSYIKFGNSWENYFLKHSKDYNRKSSSMLMINLLTHMFVGLLTENNIKKGGPLMWIESHLSTIKSHPDFLWPDVGNVCRHRGEQYKLLTIWYKKC